MAPVCVLMRVILAASSSPVAKGGRPSRSERSSFIVGDGLTGQLAEARIRFDLVGRSQLAGPAPPATRTVRAVEGVRVVMPSCHMEVHKPPLSGGWVGWSAHHQVYAVMKDDAAFAVCGCHI